MVMEIVISLIILFVGIAVLVSIHFCIVGRAFGTNNNDHNISEEEHTQRSSRITMVKRVSGDLKNLPCFDYDDREGSSRESHVDCAVCLESFKLGDACRLLPNCGHSFHVQCIDLWILKTPFCPICRTWVHSTVMMMREDSAVTPNSVQIEMP